IKAIDESYHSIHECSICGNLTENDTCDICNDKNRNHNIICVVTNTKDVIAMEKIEEYKGVYHVLGGEISTTKGILPEDLRIKELLDRITEETQEVIIATNPTVDGETTALYLGKLLQSKDVVVTRIAHGLPMGGHLDYADELTLIKAIEGRKRI
ncbi:MAG: recombination protein RecR, partial [Erysipelotrichales bacterium]|nr:recombination protein RecR [Erysipelotrichales bacterium]